MPLSNAPQENPELDDLSFEQLQAAIKLANKTFKETDRGFENAHGGRINISESQNGNFKFSRIDPSLSKVHHFIVTNPGILQTGSPDKDEFMKAVREMMTELGYKIIE